MISYLIAGLFIILGVCLRVFKWDFLIAGFNTMSQEKKKNVDRVGLTRAMGNFCLAIGGLMMISGIATTYGYRLLALLGYLTIFPLTVFILFYVQRFDHNPRNKKLETRIALIILIPVGLLLGALFFVGTREAQVSFTEDRISIGGIYGRDIQYDHIENVELVEEIPKIERKIGGMDVGYNLRGNFQLEDMGRGRLFIHSNLSPYIIIHTENQYFILNFRDPEQTKSVYQELNEQL
ncbi:DUF3784 domain-containing protein [Serpentinicella sp. ANB-PHB4]|uniref:DUF3784 domain-containing protein n=1 Tax=Serpentinicella sp. ANB-PHB4 TaxID=3074076 RepID=UPI00285654A9|nr:DUF3784 domain-containing protein [Serpentinicella sp. ANB-PHB4]MDR5659845.1 DUF3784 domain-containing protein [Serpentinicella sp. ANB-PHB4]